MRRLRPGPDGNAFKVVKVSIVSIVLFIIVVIVVIIVVVFLAFVVFVVVINPVMIAVLSRLEVAHGTATRQRLNIYVRLGVVMIAEIPTFILVIIPSSFH